MQPRRWPGHISIPPGAQPPNNPSPTASWANYNLDGSDESLAETDWRSPTTPRPHSSYHPLPRTQSARATVFNPNETDAHYAFPEPQLYRTSSAISGSLTAPVYAHHKASRSEIGPINGVLRHRDSLESLPMSEHSIDDSASNLTHELSNLSISWEENLYRFQAGQLSEAEEEWHRLVSAEARESLPKKEVQRQSVLFEVIKAEKDYVSDLEVLKDVFINPLLDSAIMPQQYIQGFCDEVFWNLEEILHYHQRMLGALFERQREQHPLIQSVADLILDTALRFRPSYESYIKHYPLAEAQHRRELRRNPDYHTFMQKCLQDPRTKKRDLITFISRPVTRLPRLNLVLEHIQKLTEPDHPDLEQLPIISEILSDFIKSTQPGIAAAESKVKFWSLVENLEFKAGESINMDVYNENRTLIYQGALARRQRSETDWHGWHDLDVALLDNYLLLTRKETRKGGTKHVITSRPLPLEYLRLGSFETPPENRKMKSTNGSGPLSALQSRTEPYYPFTIYHASAKLSRRYTLYAGSERIRTKWKDVLVDALGVRKAQQEANQLYVLETLNDGFFRSRTEKTPTNVKTTGRIVGAGNFKSGNRNFVVVATSQALYVSLKGEQKMTAVVRMPNACRLAILQNFNKLIIQCDRGVLSYSLELLARVSQQPTSNTAADLLEGSMERVTPKEESVQFFRTGYIAERMIVVYASKSFMQTNIHGLEVVSQDSLPLNPRGGGGRNASADYLKSFRSFGSPFYVPKDAFDITMLRKTMAISTEKGLSIVDPTHLSSGHVTTIPDFTNAQSDAAIASLKSRCEAARALGIVQSGESELLMIYDEFGCYVTKHGSPARKCQLVRWETNATSYLFRSGHLILVSPDFLEVREVSTGCLVQVIEGQDFRVVHTGGGGSTAGWAHGEVLIAMRGAKDDEEGRSDALVQVIETAPLVVDAGPNGDSLVWDEWD